MRILVVEDEASIAADLVEALTSVGYVVDVARDGEDGWYKGSTEDYDAMVLDLSLPRIDGPAALARLRALDPRVPVILSSGSFDSSLEALDIAGDVQGVLPKPYTTKQMLEVLQAV